MAERGVTMTAWRVWPPVRRAAADTVTAGPPTAADAPAGGPASGPDTLSVRVRKRLGALDLDVDAALPAHGITAVFGRSGAGKSSLLDCVAGVQRPDAGHVRLGGRTLVDTTIGVDLPPQARRIGYVFQDARLFPHLSVERNLRFGLRRARGRPVRVDFDGLVDLLGIGALLARRPHRLSGGERQRVAIGRALLSQPDLLLLDEPLGALDAARKAEVLPCLERLRDAFGLPMLYVTHAVDEVLRLADHVLLLSEGRAVATGPVAEVLSRPDLRPVVGRHEAGAVLECRVERHDPAWQLSTLAFAGGRLRVPLVALPEGAPLRVRVRSRDVGLALAEPSDLSITNRFAGRVVDIRDADGPFAEVWLSLDGGARLAALVTRESVARLRLAEGTRAWALLKSVAVDARSLGGARPARDDPSVPMHPRKP